jgi:hypothetical protein
MSLGQNSLEQKLPWHDGRKMPVESILLPQKSCRQSLTDGDEQQAKNNIFCRKLKVNSE